MSDYLTISDALEALRENTITATELVQNAYATADAVDSELGIYLARFDGQALAAAAEADRIAAGDPAGALLGIPLGIKDIISTREGETTAQSLVLDREWGAGIGDAVVTARLRAAGGVIAGKMTTMEYATGVPDPTKPFPIPKNPWNTEYWTGGSSSAPGAAWPAGPSSGVWAPTPAAASGSGRVLWDLRAQGYLRARTEVRLCPARIQPGQHRTDGPIGARLCPDAHCARRSRRQRRLCGRRAGGRLRRRTDR